MNQKVTNFDQGNCKKLNESFKGGDWDVKNSSVTNVDSIQLYLYFLEQNCHDKIFMCGLRQQDLNHYESLPLDVNDAARMMHSSYNDLYNKLGKSKKAELVLSNCLSAYVVNTITYQQLSAKLPEALDQGNSVHFLVSGIMKNKYSDLTLRPAAFITDKSGPASLDEIKSFAKEVTVKDNN